MANNISKKCPHCFGSGRSPFMRHPRPGQIESPPCLYCGGTGLGPTLVIRIFHWMSMAAWAVAFVSLFLLGGIESAALRHPTESTDEYSVPMKVKCCVHYVTSDQDLYDKLAFSGFVGGGLAFVVFVKVIMWLEDRRKRLR